MRKFLQACLTLSGPLVAAFALAQGIAYPQKPIRLIVPAPAGGPTDVPGRLIADGLSNLVGQRFVVENRVGAGGLVAGEYVSRAPADGYTLLYANTSVLAVNPALQGANMPYDPARAFTPVGFVSNSPQLLVGNPKLPYRTVQELVAWAKAHPGKLNFATAGVGTLPHLTYELFKMETGIDALNVPYSGGGPALTAVISGQADVLFDLGDGHRGPRRDSEGHRRDAEREAQRADRTPRDPGEDEVLRPGPEGGDARGVRRLGRAGARALDPRGESLGREGRVMAKLAAAFGSSHSVMLAAELEDWLRGFRQSDLRMKFYDNEGKPRTYQ